MAPTSPGRPAKGRSFRQSRRRALAGLALLLLLLLTLLVLLPRLVNTPALQRRVLEEVSQTIGGTVTARVVHLALLPRPHVELRQGTLTVPDLLEGSFRRLSIYPRGRAVLYGRLELERIVLQDPLVRVQLPLPGPRPPEAAPLTRKEVERHISGLLEELEDRAPRLLVQIRGGRVALVGATERPLVLSELTVDLRLPPRRLELALSCRGNLWRQLQVEGDLTPGLDGRIAVRLDGLAPPPLESPIFPELPVTLGPTELDVDIELWSFGGAKRLATVQVCAPWLEVRRRDRPATFTDGWLMAELRQEDPVLAVHLEGLELSEPRFELSGRLLLDTAAPWVDLELAGSGIDVTAVRQRVLALAGPDPLIEEVLDIVRGGTLSQATLYAEAPRPAQLGELRHFSVEGEASQARISVRSIGLDLTDVAGRFRIQGGVLTGNDLSGRLGRSSAREGKLELDLLRPDVPFDLEMQLRAELAELKPMLLRWVPPGELHGHLARLEDLRGTGDGALELHSRPDSFQVAADIRLREAAVRYRPLSEPLRIARARVAYDGQRLRLGDVALTLGSSSVDGLDLLLSLSGRLALTAGLKRAELVLPELLAYLRALPELGRGAQQAGPVVELLRSPLHLAGTRLRWREGGGTALAGKLTRPGGLEIGFDLVRGADGRTLTVPGLTILDEHSRTRLELDVNRDSYRFGFTGNLAGATVDKLLRKNPYLTGWVAGSFAARFSPAEPTRASATGKLAGKGLRLPWPPGTPFLVDSFALHGEGKRVVLERAELDLQPGTLVLSGQATTSRDFLVFSLDASSPELDAQALAARVAPQQTAGPEVPPGRAAAEREQALKPEKLWDLPLRGSVQLAVDRLALGGYTWAPARASAALTPTFAGIQLREARLCNITQRGSITIRPQVIELNLLAEATREPLDETIECLLAKKRVVKGLFGFSGRFWSLSEPRHLLPALQGRVGFKAESGRIYKFRVLSKIFAFLDVFSVFRGKLPDLATEGLSYSSMEAEGTIKNGVLELEKGVIHGSSLVIVVQGNVDIVRQRLDLTVLVAPFRTLGIVISYIPIVGYIFGGSLVSIPLGVRGPLDKPTVTPLPPEAVGKQLLGLLERIVKLPWKIIQPLLPK